MMIPIGRRRFVLTLVAAPRPARPADARDLSAALAATDAELVRLAHGNAVGVERARWEAMALMYGPRMP